MSTTARCIAILMLGMTVATECVGQQMDQSATDDRVDGAAQSDAHDDDSSALNIDRSARWSTRATVSGWYPSLNGDQSLRGAPEFDIDLIDQADNQIAPRLELTFRRDRWSVIASGFLFGIDQSATVDGGSFASGGVTVNQGDRVSYDIRYGSADLLIGYRLPSIPISNGERDGVAGDPFSTPEDGVGLFFDVLAGARLWHLDYEMEQVGGPELIDQRSTWVDPVIGARMMLDLPKGWGMELRSDIGGFGVGSDFAWNIEVAFQGRVAENIGVEIGFRHLQTDYETGSGAEELNWEMALAGLYGSVVISF